jgi:ATP-dependent Zn protease
MVGSFGMAGTLLSFDAVQGNALASGIVAKVLADEEARRSVERILETAKRDVRDLLDSHRHLVVALRDELLEQEELVGDDILDVLAKAEAAHEPGGSP